MAGWMVTNENALRLRNVVSGVVKVILPQRQIYNNNNNTGSIFCFTATFIFLPAFNVFHDGEKFTTLSLE